MEADVALEGIKKDIQYIRERMDSFMDLHRDTEKRLKTLEDWKLVFVTKFTTYATLALVAGSFIGQLALKYLERFL